MIKKSDLINILNIWNYWNKDIPEIYTRKDYEKIIGKYRSSGEIIVLKGIRRSGKSTLLTLEIKNLLKKVNKKNILFVNLEEPKFMNDLNVELLDHIYETYLDYLEPKGKVYLFLDEIQNIPGWEKWVLRIYEKENVQIYVTGSSSKLLSSEFSTALGGRHLSIDIYPLSFKEYLDFKNLRIKSKFDIDSNQRIIKKLFESYLKNGGFPRISFLEDELLIKNELMSYYDTIILKDIVKRYEISNISDLRKLSFFLLSNISKPYSVNNLKKLGLGAYDTIKKYIDYLKEVYLLFDVEMFSYSLKQQLINPKKIYAVDTGLVNAVSFRFSEDRGRLLENLIFIELKRRNKEVYYHRGKKECDFVIKEGLDIVEAIQVATSLEDPETRKREVLGLVDAMKTYNLKEGLILTEDEEDEYIEKDKKTGREFKIIMKPIWKFLINL